MSERGELAEIAAAVVRQAGARVAEIRASRRVEHRPKDGGRELVSAADLASDALMREALRRHTPGVRYVSEEDEISTHDWGGTFWLADPLDGTVNYVYGHSHVGIALAFVSNGRVEAGAVHAPFAGETFVAARGEGATRNGTALAALPETPLADALVSTGFPHDQARLGAIMRRLARVLPRCRDIRRLASPALEICWVADGRLDAAYETLRPWDVAAAGLVAREAGVARAHYTDVPAGLPPEVCGENVVFARPALLSALLPLLRDPDRE